MFFGFSLFVFFFTIIACKVAADELADLNKHHQQPQIEISAEIIS